MVRFPDEKELRQLKSFEKPSCVTVYAPHIDQATTADSDRIELKNLLREAETALRSAGTKPRDIQKTLGPGRQLVDGREFWPPRHDSLVLFMHPKLFRYYHIPEHAVPYLLTVGGGFNLKPLLKIMRRNRPYFVLALGHKNVRLYEGDHYHFGRKYMKDWPADMEKALNIDEYPNWRETHTIGPASTGKGSEAYHGQYNVKQTDKEMLLQFFRRIDKRLHSLLTRRRLPLVITGANYLLPIYRQANTYPGLLACGIAGSPKLEDRDRLRERAWRLVSRDLNHV
ncbi:MAG TPA: hypothetical protein VMU97_00850 [Candidatus Dormibacteraeota bacterium]|nr:hypothetical protein [Candidatus Dormibacteraeota bacterium]